MTCRKFRTKSSATLSDMYRSLELAERRRKIERQRLEFVAISSAPMILALQKC